MVLEPPLVLPPKCPRDAIHLCREINAGMGRLVEIQRHIARLAAEEKAITENAEGEPLTQELEFEVAAISVSVNSYAQEFFQLQAEVMELQRLLKALEQV